MRGGTGAGSRFQAEGFRGTVGTTCGSSCGWRRSPRPRGSAALPIADHRDRDRLFFTPPGERASGKVAFVFPGAGNHFADMDKPGKDGKTLVQERRTKFLEMGRKGLAA